MDAPEMRGKSISSEADVRYRKALSSIPKRGYGCHPALLGTANLGVLLRLGKEEIFKDIRRARPEAAVSYNEVRDAVEKAWWELSYVTQEAGLWEASPVRIDWPIPEDAKRFLSSLYEPDDNLQLGGIYSGSLKSVAAYIAASSLCDFEYIVPNPLTEAYGPKKSGGFSIRADSSIKRFLFILSAR